MTRQLTLLFILITQISFAQVDITFDADQSFCSLDNQTCLGEVEYPFSLSADDPNSLNLSYQLVEEGDTLTTDPYGNLSGVYPDYSISGDYPIGQYSFLLEITEGSGEVTMGALGFEVKDCHFPPIYCINGLASEVMALDLDGDGETDEYGVQLYAVDMLVDQPEDNCSPNPFYTINRSGEFPDPTQDYIILNCWETTVPLQIHMWTHDSTQLVDYCETYALVQSNQFCESTPSISGRILREDGQAIAGAIVTLSGDQDEVLLTGPSGEFSFQNLTAGGDYSISVEKTFNPLNGVTTLDMAYTSRHILGITPFESNYAHIAADVNNSETVTALDLVMIRRLILGQEQSFPNNTSWRFFDADYEFPNPDYPWAESVPEVIHINNLPADQVEYNFIGVKVGDPNLTNDPYN